MTFNTLTQATVADRFLNVLPTCHKIFPNLAYTQGQYYQNLLNRSRLGTSLNRKTCPQFTILYHSI